MLRAEPLVFFRPAPIPSNFHSANFSFQQTLGESIQTGKRTMLKIAIIMGSTRPNRNSEAVAKWAFDIAKKRPSTEATFELIDLRDFNLPLLDEPVPPSMGQYSKEHTKKWAAKIDTFDGFIFVTPEY